MNEEVIITSDEHPFYVVGKGFIPASELRSNDQLVSLDFKLLSVVSNKRLTRKLGGRVLISNMALLIAKYP